jgi:hypothetical protein
LGKVPTGEDSFFQFLAQPSKAGSYTFQVPAPTIEAKSPLGGAGTSTLTIIALVIVAVALVVAIVALVGRGAR